MAVSPGFSWSQLTHVHNCFLSCAAADLWSQSSPHSLVEQCLVPAVLLFFSPRIDKTENWYFITSSTGQSGLSFSNMMVFFWPQSVQCSVRTCNEICFTQPVKGLLGWNTAPWSFKWCFRGTDIEYLNFLRFCNGLMGWRLNICNYQPQGKICWFTFSKTCIVWNLFHVSVV